MTEQTNDLPLISIIIPCYNQGDFVKDAIESALRQTYPFKEVIVVDDGSTDDSRRQIASYGDAVRLVESPARRQAGAARNLGFENSRGEFIQFLDSDDVLLPTKVYDHYTVAASDPDADIVYGILRYADSDSIKRPEYRSKEPITPRERELIELYLGLDEEQAVARSLKECLQASCFLFRRRSLTRYGLFNTELRTNEDNEIMFRHAVQGAVLRFHPSVTNLYRQYYSDNRRTTAKDYHLLCEEALDVMIEFTRRNNLMSRSFSRSFAEELWRYSWDAVWSQDYEAAERLVARARSLYGETCGPAWFKALTKVMPPASAQKLTWKLWTMGRSVLRKRRPLTAAYGGLE